MKVRLWNALVCAGLLLTTASVFAADWAGHGGYRSYKSEKAGYSSCHQAGISVVESTDTVAISASVSECNGLNKDGASREVTFTKNSEGQLFFQGQRVGNIENNYIHAEWVSGPDQEYWHKFEFDTESRLRNAGKFEWIISDEGTHHDMYGVVTKL